MIKVIIIIIITTMSETVWGSIFKADLQHVAKPSKQSVIFRHFIRQKDFAEAWWYKITLHYAKDIYNTSITCKYMGWNIVVEANTRWTMLMLCRCARADATSNAAWIPLQRAHQVWFQKQYSRTNSNSGVCAVISTKCSLSPLNKAVADFKLDKQQMLAVTIIEVKMLNWCRNDTCASHLLRSKMLDPILQINIPYD